MDYFYVGNHINSVGLLDIYLKLNQTINSKSNLSVAVHNFSAAAEINPSTSMQLGTEVDIVYGYKLYPNVGIKAGYSQVFTTKGMEIIKAKSNPDNTNNWGWVMLTINPTIFTSKK